MVDRQKSGSRTSKATRDIADLSLTAESAVQGIFGSARVIDADGRVDAVPAGAQALSLSATTTSAMTAMKTGALSRVDIKLAALYYGQTGQATRMSAFICTVQHNANAISADSRYVLIDTTAKDGDGAALLADIQALGIKNGSSFGAVASGWLPVSAIRHLGMSSNLGFARESAFTTAAGLVTTQADVAQRSDIARIASGVSGAGVRIGVLSDSFNVSNMPSQFTGFIDDMSSNIGTGDLPRDTQIIEDAFEGTDEGRAMGQIVHDIAPGAAIDFATAFNGQAGFANNILRLAAAGDRIIVDDVSYYGELTYQNGIIAQAVNQVASQGVAYFSSAGNSGMEGYEGVWSEGQTLNQFGNDYRMMEFAPGQDYLEITNPANSTIILQWDQPGAAAGGVGSASDLDLYLLDDSGNVSQFSFDSNMGADPIEGFQVPEYATGTFRLQVGLLSGAAPGLVRILVYGNGDTQLQSVASNINPGTLAGHHGAEGNIAVGAAAFFDTPAYNSALTTGLAEPFTSGGYVKTLFDDDGNRLATPEVNGVSIVAVDGGNTTFFGGDGAFDPDPLPNFFGTSASAPGAAAVAALMLQANPQLNGDDLRILLEYSALDMNDPTTTGFDIGRDRLTGAGLIQADLAVQLATVRDLRNMTDVALVGTRLSDTITAGALDNSIASGDGDDTVMAGEGADTVSGGNGNDALYGNQGDDILRGNNGDDSLYGGQGTDQLYGGMGNDILEGGLGDDLLNGGEGRANIASHRSAASAVTINLEYDSVSGGAGSDKFINIQGVEGSAFDDQIDGNTDANILFGGGGADIMRGDAYIAEPFSDDIMDGGAGDDLMDGDTAEYYSNYGGNDVMNGGAGADMIRGGGGNDTLDGGGKDQPIIRNTIDRADIVKPASLLNHSMATALVLNTGGDGDFDLMANPSIVDSQIVPHATIKAQFSALDGKEYYSFDATAGTTGMFDVDTNRLNGRYFGTRMTLYDANGVELRWDDYFVGEDSNSGDFFAAYFKYDFDQSGKYYITIEDSGLADKKYTGPADVATYTLNISLSNAEVAYDGTLTVINDVMLGGEGVDTSTYAAATSGVTVDLDKVNTIQDTGYGLQNMSSIENLIGSAFDDTLLGNRIENVIQGGAGYDLITGGDDQDTLYGNQGDDTLYGNQARDRLYGGQGNDTLYGGQGDDIMFGNLANDILQGGRGVDVMTGGEGADRFRYVTAADSTIAETDTVTDFEVGVDRIDLLGVRTGVADVFSIDQSFGNVLLSVDLGGDGTQDMQIRLIGATGFSVSDIDWNPAVAAPAMAAADFIIPHEAGGLSPQRMFGMMAASGHGAIQMV